MGRFLDSGGNKAINKSAPQRRRSEEGSAAPTTGG